MITRGRPFGSGLKERAKLHWIATAAVTTLVKRGHFSDS
jgi:hypothetical protein